MQRHIIFWVNRIIFQQLSSCFKRIQHSFPSQRKHNYDIGVDSWGGHDRPTYLGISRNISRILVSIVYEHISGFPPPGLQNLHLVCSSRREPRPRKNFNILPSALQAAGHWDRLSHPGRCWGEVRWPSTVPHRKVVCTVLRPRRRTGGGLLVSVFIIIRHLTVRTLYFH